MIARIIHLDLYYLCRFRQMTQTPCIKIIVKLCVKQSELPVYLHKYPNLKLIWTS